MIEWTLRKDGKAKSFKDVPKGATIERVNGRYVVGTCENCCRPILEGQGYQRDSEGVEWHDNCPRKREVKP